VILVFFLQFVMESEKQVTKMSFNMSIPRRGKAADVEAKGFIRQGYDNKAKRSIYQCIKCNKVCDARQVVSHKCCITTTNHKRMFSLSLSLFFLLIFSVEVSSLPEQKKPVFLCISDSGSSSYDDQEIVALIKAMKEASVSNEKLEIFDATGKMSLFLHTHTHTLFFLTAV